MKVAFWSNAGEKNGVTSNLACISIASAMEYPYKSILIENHNQKNKLENVLMYNLTGYHLRKETDFHLKHIGMNYILNQLSNPRTPIRAENTPGLIEEASVEILRNSLYYIPPSFLTNSYTYEYDLYGNINHILDVLETFADITYIDTTNRNNLSSKVILDAVDLVVVNLVQNAADIQHFFENYSSILSKCVFLISSYHKESVLNINRISKANLIDKNSIATIPYNVEYQEAVSQGTIVEFLSRNYTCKRSNPNYPFVKEVKKAVCMIMSNIDTIRQKEACR